jgi:hypothetical protein
MAIQLPPNVERKLVDATDDPAELARRAREGEESMRNLARNRAEMDGPKHGGLWVFVASRKVRRVLLSLLTVALCYVVSYTCLSEFGRYEPASIGLAGVKSYWWAPAGFVKDYRYRMSLFYLYLPLHWADRAVWHRDDDADSGKYPIHVPKDISEVYAAWRK